MRCDKIARLAVLCACAGSAAGTARASIFSFTGTFSTDDQLEIFSFVAGSTSAVMRTWGFAGGVNAAGSVISDGGFDPVLSLYGPGPALLPSTDLLNISTDGGSSVPADPTSFEHFDSFIDTAAVPLTLIAGETYFLVLSENDNLPLGNKFGDGFSEQGAGNFSSNFGCPSGPFCDLDVENRNGNWAVDITGVTSAVDTSSSSVPEPHTSWLLAGVAGLCVGLRSRASKHSSA